MKSYTAAAVGSLLLGAAQSQVVLWDIERREAQPGSEEHWLSRRASTVNSPINNIVQRGGYFAKCTLGTPSQELTLQLDTGSSDIWVPENTASICQSTKSNGGCSLGSCKSDAMVLALAPPS